MKAKVVYILFLMFVAVNLSAQQKWTLRQCIDYAVENNIEIKQEALQVEGAKVDLNSTKMSRLPNLNGSISPGYGVGRNPVNKQAEDGSTYYSYESKTTFSSSFNLQSSVPVFTGMKNPNEVKKKEFDLMSATANLSKAKEDMELRVTSLYLEVLFKKEITKVYQEQLDLTTMQMEKTKAMVEAGKIPRSQQYDMMAQQAKDELNLTTASNDLDLALLNLAQALNLADYLNFDIVEPAVGEDQVANNMTSLVAAGEVYNTALAVKPHVKVAEYRLESSKKGLNVAKAGYYPTVDLNMSYGTSYNNNQIGGFGTQFRNEAREYIGLSVNIPIFNRLQTRNSVRQARLDIENQQLALDNVKLALFKEIQQAYQSATAAQSKYKSTGKALIAAEEAYKYAEDRYAVGKSSVYEFNEAQTKLLTSKSEQIQAKYDFIFRAKILDFYRGEKIEI